MQVVADLHLHSKYSRAVSPQMILPTMVHYAIDKGLHLLTASDWTHPVWFKEISALLEEAGEGVYALKPEIRNPKLETISNSSNIKTPQFVLSTEISCIYKQGDKLRRIHNLIFVSSLTKAEEFSRALVARGCNIGSDGRPIVGLTAKQVLELLLEIDDQGFLIPCHVWTPHFGLYGSASGFDSIEEAFGDLSSSIYGVETGLSSDPEMNWQIPELATRSILSFSDAHSPAKMGREATVFELKAIDFKHLKQAIMQPFVIASEQRERGNLEIASLQEDYLFHRVASFSTHYPKGTSYSVAARNDKNRVLYTIEFYPEEGKYHFSGHRTCKVRYTPEELKEKGNICPVCRRPLTEGVFVRLKQLSGKDTLDSAVIKPNDQGLNWFTDPEKIHPPYVKLVPLLEIIAETMDSTVMSQKVKLTYTKAIKGLGSELDILLKIPETEIAHMVGEKIAQAVGKVRRGDIIIDPGFDGEYGVVKIWTQENTSEADGGTDSPQMSLEF